MSRSNTHKHLTTSKLTFVFPLRTSSLENKVCPGQPTTQRKPTAQTQRERERESERGGRERKESDEQMQRRATNVQGSVCKSDDEEEEWRGTRERGGHLSAALV